MENVIPNKKMNPKYFEPKQNIIIWWLIIARIQTTSFNHSLNLLSPRNMSQS